MENSKTVITPPSRFSLNLKELWHYRELFYFFSWRDIKVKYKQTYLGIAWVVMQPLLLMLLFTFVFKRLQTDTSSIRYEIYVLSGLLFWSFFNSSISNASNSIIDQSNVIKKVYFPRLIIPLSALLVALFELFIMLLIFLVLCFVFRQGVQWQAVLFFPLSFVVAFIAAAGISIFLSALTVKYRDFRYLIPFFLQVLFFSSTIIYSVKNIQNEWMRSLLALNPINAVIELFRASFTNTFDKNLVLIGIASSVVVTLIGLLYFKRTEAYFADLS